MATEIARMNLELASGRNESTAPFQQTAQRRRIRAEETPVEADATELPANARVVVDVPLGDFNALPSAPPSAPEIVAKPSIGRLPWLAFISVAVAVAAAVWLVMFQLLPDIDPHEVIERNLDDARGAMAEGRYTDPPERSAFHYYSTVLALDPDNSHAIAGIDAIADRHLTNARVMLAEQRVAEAAVAIDRARRVRPHHSSLADLDTQMRIQLKKILAVANAPLQSQVTKPKVTKAPSVAAARTSAPAVPLAQPSLARREVATPSTMTTPPESKLTSTPSAVRVAKLPPMLALAPSNAEQTSPSLITPATADALEPGSAPVVEEPADVSAAAALPESAPAPVPTVAPKLIKMVQPEYPQEALMRGFEGWVDVSLEVNAAGDVVGPRIEDSSRGRLFNRAALSAVQQWKYEPRTDGNANERLRVRVQFRHSR
jgi:TonB family protein